MNTESGPKRPTRARASTALGTAFALGLGLGAYVLLSGAGLGGGLEAGSPRSSGILPRRAVPVEAEPYRLDLAGVRRSRDADLARMTPVRLIRVVDGDTIIVSLSPPPRGLSAEERVRIIGLDAPEVGKKAEKGGGVATRELERILGGRDLLLAFDRDLRDRYGRVLAYVFLPDGRSAALEMIRKGFAAPLLKYPFALREEYREAGRP